MSTDIKNRGRIAFIVDGSRTPFLKARGRPGPFSGADLAVAAGRPLLARQSFKPSDLGEVIIGCMMPGPDEATVARIVGMRLGTGKHVPAWSVQRNCASGLQAIDCAAGDIAQGRHQLVLAGGTDAMSRAPLLFSDAMVLWFSAWMGAKTLGQRLKALSKLSPSYFVPVISLLRGLTDPISTLSMGQTAEVVAHRFGMTRTEMDTFAAESHKRVLNAQAKGYFSEIETLYDTVGNFYEKDDGVRTDTTLEKLASLKPFFDKKFGLVTAGNSSQVTDGAALLLMASREAIQQYGLKVLARVVDVEWAAVEPKEMGLGPVHAVAKLLKRHQLALSDIDAIEMNEAFAGQVLGCLKAWESSTYCQEALGLGAPLGAYDPARLNIDGGAIALGHPIGASGARVTLHLIHVLKRLGGRYGIATLCIGGGQGGAVLIEALEGVVD